MTSNITNKQIVGIQYVRHNSKHKRFIQYVNQGSKQHFYTQYVKPTKQVWHPICGNCFITVFWHPICETVSNMTLFIKIVSTNVKNKCQTCLQQFKTFKQFPNASQTKLQTCFNIFNKSSKPPFVGFLIRISRMLMATYFTLKCVTRHIKCKKCMR